MLGFNYNEFKSAAQRVKEEKHNELVNDINVSLIGQWETGNLAELLGYI